MARVATLTAIRVLQVTGLPEAREVLHAWTRSFSGRIGPDAALLAHANRALRTLDGQAEPADRRNKMDKLVEAALNASARQDRVKALRKLAEDAYVEAIPALRVSLAGDVSGEVRSHPSRARPIKV